MSKKSKIYSEFQKTGDLYIGKLAGAGGALPAGLYEVLQDPASGRIYFREIDKENDEILDLPSKEYTQVVEEIETFLKPETKQLFKDYKFVYKRSALLYGLPGTGKTCILDRIIDHMLKLGGVVLFNPNPNLVALAMQQISNVQPDILVCIVFEELDKLVDKFEGTLLNLLDGEIQWNNVVYMATTNFIDKIPARIRRPGRFSSIIEVKYPNLETRQFYLETKLGKDSADVNSWAEKTSGLSIDELKETVLAVKCLGIPLEDVITRIRGNSDNPEKQSSIDETDFEDEIDPTKDPERVLEPIRGSWL